MDLSIDLRNQFCKNQEKKFAQSTQCDQFFAASNQILARMFFRSVAHPLACPAAGKFSRASYAAHVGESNSRSNVFQIRRATACVPSRWKVLSGEFRRRPTALAIKLRNPDRVGRRGLSEPREDFSRLNTYAWTQK